MQYKVIFNGDKDNYEIFEDRASAERFAQGYINTRIIKEPVVSKRLKERNLDEIKKIFEKHGMYFDSDNSPKSLMDNPLLKMPQMIVPSEEFVVLKSACTLFLELSEVLQAQYDELNRYKTILSEIRKEIQKGDDK